MSPRACLVSPRVLAVTLWTATAHKTNRHTRAQQRVVVTAASERVIPAYKAMVGWTVIDPETEEEVADVSQIIWLWHACGFLSCMVVSDGLIHP